MHARKPPKVLALTNFFQIFFQQSLKKKAQKVPKKRSWKLCWLFRACFNYWKSWLSRLEVWLLQILSEICPPLSQKLDKSGCHLMIPLHYPTPILLFEWSLITEEGSSLLGEYICFQHFCLLL
jgi:hypothetical protein